MMESISSFFSPPPPLPLRACWFWNKSNVKKRKEKYTNATLTQSASCILLLFELQTTFTTTTTSAIRMTNWFLSDHSTNQIDSSCIRVQYSTVRSEEGGKEEGRKGWGRIEGDANWHTWVKLCWNKQTESWASTERGNNIADAANVAKPLRDREGKRRGERRFQCHYIGRQRLSYFAFLWRLFFVFVFVFVFFF